MTDIQTDRLSAFWDMQTSDEKNFISNMNKHMSVISVKRDKKDNQKVHIVLKKVDIEHPVIKIVFLHQIQESMRKMLLTICFLHLVCSEQFLDNNGIDEQVEKEGESKGKDYTKIQGEKEEESHYWF